MLALITALVSALLAGAVALSRMKRQRRLRDETRGLYRLLIEEGEGLESALADRLPEAEQIGHLPPLPGSKPWAAGDEVLGLAQKAAEAMDQLPIVRMAMSEERWDEARQRLDLLLATVHETNTGLRILEERLAALDRTWGLPATAAVLLQRARGRKRPATADETTGGVEEAVAKAEAALSAHVGMPAEARAAANRDLAKALGALDDWMSARERRPRIVDLVRTETPVLMERVEDAGIRKHPDALPRLAAMRRDMAKAGEALDAGRPDVAERLGRQVRDRGQRLLKDLQAGILPIPGDHAFDKRTLAIQAGAPAVIVGLLASATSSQLAWMGPATDRINGRAEVVQGAPARVTSKLREGLGADKLTDGRPETAWIAAQTLLDGPVAVIGLKEATPLASISVLPCAVPAAPCTWEVDVSADRRSWFTVGSATGTGARSPDGATWGTVTLDATASWRLIRIRPLAWGKSGVGIFEVRAWRRAPSPGSR